MRWDSVQHNRDASCSVCGQHYRLGVRVRILASLHVLLVSNCLRIVQKHPCKANQRCWIIQDRVCCGLYNDLKSLKPDNKRLNKQTNNGHVRFLNCFNPKDEKKSDLDSDRKRRRAGSYPEEVRLSRSLLLYRCIAPRLTSPGFFCSVDDLSGELGHRGQRGAQGEQGSLHGNAAPGQVRGERTQHRPASPGTRETIKSLTGRASTRRHSCDVILEPVPCTYVHIWCLSMTRTNEWVTRSFKGRGENNKLPRTDLTSFSSLNQFKIYFRYIIYYYYIIIIYDIIFKINWRQRCRFRSSSASIACSPLEGVEFCRLCRYID